MRKNKKINIIYKDDQIVVCEKPKGIPVSSDKTGDMDLLHQLKNQLFFEENTDGEPQLYLVHRLDRPSNIPLGRCFPQYGIFRMVMYRRQL